MKVADIINKVSLFLFSSDDICYVSNNLKVCEEFMNKFRNDGEYTEEKKKFLIKNQNSINADNLLLKIIENYYGNIELLKSEIIEMKKDSGNESQQLLLKAIGSNEVELSFTSEMKPFIIKNKEDNTVVQLVLPVRTYQ